MPGNLETIKPVPGKESYVANTETISSLPLLVSSSTSVKGRETTEPSKLIPPFTNKFEESLVTLTVPPHLTFSVTTSHTDSTSFVYHVTYILPQSTIIVPSSILNKYMGGDYKSSLSTISPAASKVDPGYATQTSTLFYYVPTAATSPLPSNKDLSLSDKGSSKTPSVTDKPVSLPEEDDEELSEDPQNIGSSSGHTAQISSVSPAVSSGKDLNTLPEDVPGSQTGDKTSEDGSGRDLILDTYNSSTELANITRICSSDFKFLNGSEMSDNKMVTLLCDMEQEIKLLIQKEYRNSLKTCLNSTVLNSLLQKFYVKNPTYDKVHFLSYAQNLFEVQYAGLLNKQAGLNSDITLAGSLLFGSQTSLVPISRWRRFAADFILDDLPESSLLSCLDELKDVGPLENVPERLSGLVLTMPELSALYVAVFELSYCVNIKHGCKVLTGKQLRRRLSASQLLGFKMEEQNSVSKVSNNSLKLRDFSNYREK